MNLTNLIASSTEIIVTSGLKKYEIAYYIEAQPEYFGYLPIVQRMIDTFRINTYAIDWATSNSILGIDNNTGLEIRIQYPSNWQRSEYDNKDILFLSPSESISDISREGIGISILPSVNITVPDLANEQLNSFKELYQDFHFIESKSTTFKGNQAYILQYIYTDKIFGRVI